MGEMADTAKIWRSCSWCHAHNPAGSYFCAACGHAAHRPRVECDCAACTGARQPFRCLHDARYPLPDGGTGRARVYERQDRLRRLALCEADDAREHAPGSVAAVLVQRVLRAAVPEFFRHDWFRALPSDVIARIIERDARGGAWAVTFGPATERGLSPDQAWGRYFARIASVSALDAGAVRAIIGYEPEG